MLLYMLYVVLEYVDSVTKPTPGILLHRAARTTVCRHDSFLLLLLFLFLRKRHTRDPGTYYTGRRAYYAEATRFVPHTHTIRHHALPVRHATAN